MEGPLLIQNAGRDLFDATSKSGVDLSSAIRRVEEGVRHGLRNQAEGLPHEPKAILNIMRHKPWSDCGCTWFELRSIAESEGVAQDKSPAAIDTVQSLGYVISDEDGTYRYRHGSAGEPIA